MQVRGTQSDIRSGGGHGETERERENTLEWWQVKQPEVSLTLVAIKHKAVVPRALMLPATQADLPFSPRLISSLLRAQRARDVGKRQTPGVYANCSPRCIELKSNGNNVISVCFCSICNCSDAELLKFEKN